MRTTCVGVFKGEQHNFRGPTISDLSPVTETSLTRRSLCLLVIGLITFGMGFSLLFAILPPLGRQLGLTEFQVGIVFGTGQLVLFFCAPIWGRKSDLWGRKLPLIIGFVGFAVLMLAFVAVIELGLNGIIGTFAVFALLLASRAAFAATVSAVNGPASGYIADTTTEKDRTAALSWVNASHGIGTAIGPGIGALLAGLGVLVPLYAVCGWALVMGLLLFFFLPEPRVHRPSTHRKRMRIRDKRILPLAILTIVSFFVITANLQLAAFLVQDRIGYNPEDTTQAVGGLLTTMAGAALLTQIFIIRRFKLHPFALMAMGMPLGCLAVLGVTFSGNLIAFALSFAALGLAIGLVGPALSGAASLSVSGHEQGGVAGIVEGCRALGALSASLLGTALYGFDPHLPYGLTAGALGLMSIYVIYRWAQQRRSS